MKREEVYKAIDSEREYQDNLWLNMDGSRHVHHSPEEWFMYMEDYINEAKHILSREAYGVCEQKAMVIMRKVAGMAVCAMEQNGTTNR
jgi:hypothetical protein